MRIGELARQVGYPVETIRYYEREGLLPAAWRDQNNNYRHYDQTHLEQLLFIRRCRALDMTHQEIRVLLQARHQPDADCGAVNALINEHLHHVQERIRELNRLEAQLRELQNHCSADGATGECGILRELEHPTLHAQPTSGHTSHLAGSHAH